MMAVEGRAAIGGIEGRMCVGRRRFVGGEIAIVGRIAIGGRTGVGRRAVGV
jgi:hypothetical protein